MCEEETLIPLIPTLSPWEMEQAAAKVQEEVTAAYEEAERALELLRHEGENEAEELTTE